MTTHNKPLPAASRDRGGFSLIELMIVVAIIGILAMIGIPSYDRYVIRSNRAVAKQFMLTVASKQEQYRLDARSYASSITGAGAGNLNMVPPTEAGRYNFALNDACTDAPVPPACATPLSCSTYTICAVPRAAFANQVADGWLRIDNLGSKTSQVTCPGGQPCTGSWDK